MFLKKIIILRESGIKNFSTAKETIEVLTLSLATKFSPKIKVHCIAPSLIDAIKPKNMIKNVNIKKLLKLCTFFLKLEKEMIFHKLDLTY